MLKRVDKFVKRNQDYIYFAFRVIVGLMFLQHGAQKLFGMFGGNQVELISLMGFAGVVEFFGGLFIAIGLFTQIAALIGGIQMLFAYFMAHSSRNWVPIMNGGELALMFFASFLILLIYGTRKFGLDNYFKK